MDKSRRLDLISQMNEQFRRLGAPRTAFFLNYDDFGQEWITVGDEEAADVAVTSLAALLDDLAGPAVDDDQLQLFNPDAVR